MARVTQVRSPRVVALPLRSDLCVEEPDCGRKPRTAPPFLGSGPMQMNALTGEKVKRNREELGSCSEEALISRTGRFSGGFCENTWGRYQGVGLEIHLQESGGSRRAVPSGGLGWELPRDTASRSSS
jgi:hypothetical protein